MADALFDGLGKHLRDHLRYVLHDQIHLFKFQVEKS